MLAVVNHSKEIGLLSYHEWIDWQTVQRHRVQAFKPCIIVTEGEINLWTFSSIQVPKRTAIGYLDSISRIIHGLHEGFQSYNIKCNAMKFVATFLSQ